MIMKHHPAVLALVVMLASSPMLFSQDAATYLFCGAGDNLYNTAVEPVDSPAAIDAMLDYTASTYGIKRLYWRAIGDWANDMQVGRVLSPTSWDWTRWLTYINSKFGADRTAARLAHAHGMEAFGYAGLFEFGLQPDAAAGYRFEFNIRRSHPEWIATDRWGERREAGSLSYAIPEARAFLVEYFTNLVMRDGFDGLNFYTYVENFAIHYEHEFGFDLPVVERFNQRYPDVDLRGDTLTAEQAEYWYECRGHFITLFLRELSANLHARGKKLSIILAAEEPDYVQPWWGMPIRGTGKIRLEYRKWISEGMVDEIWVQLAKTDDQRRTLDMLLPLIQGTKVKLTVRTVNPFDPGWDKYRAAGVSPIAVITWVKNGIEAYTRQTVNADSISSPDWKIRAQALRGVASGTIAVQPAALLALLNDPAVLVRRALYGALAQCAANGHPTLLPIIEDGLNDAESCVRIAAALALQKANRLESVDKLFSAIEKHPMEFQLKNTAVDAFSAIGAAGKAAMESKLSHPSPVIRELAGRGLRKLVIHNLVGQEDADAICAALQKTVCTPEEDTFLRMIFIEQTIGMRTSISREQQYRLIDDINGLLEDEQDWEVLLKAAGYCRHLSPLMAHPQQQRCKNALLALFRQYGDASTRPDAAYGWRDIGNSLVALGSIQALEELMAQRKDAFTAYNAYKVLYDPQGFTPESRKNKGFNLIDEATAVENHRKFAPPFPGNRSW